VVVKVVASSTVVAVSAAISEVALVTAMTSQAVTRKWLSG
jgi:hypothetical protein